MRAAGALMQGSGNYKHQTSMESTMVPYAREKYLRGRSCRTRYPAHHRPPTSDDDSSTAEDNLHAWSKRLNIRIALRKETLNLAGVGALYPSGGTGARYHCDVGSYHPA